MVNSKVVDLVFTVMGIQIPAFQFNADPYQAFYNSSDPWIRIQLFTLTRIRIPLIINGMGIFDHWSLDPPGLYFEPPGLHCERSWPSTAPPFEPPKLPRFHFNADPVFTPASK
jgi:hypothetical protein